MIKLIDYADQSQQNQAGTAKEWSTPTTEGMNVLLELVILHFVKLTDQQHYWSQNPHSYWVLLARILLQNSIRKLCVCPFS
jgi:hypothetical protein